MRAALVQEVLAARLRDTFCTSLEEMQAELRALQKQKKQGDEVGVSARACVCVGGLLQLQMLVILCICSCTEDAGRAGGVRSCQLDQ